MDQRPENDPGIPGPARIIDLSDLEAVAAALGASPGGNFARTQLERAVGLTRSLELGSGMKVLVVNAPLGKPWNVLAMLLCGCQVTILGDNKKQVLALREEFQDLPHRHRGIPRLPDFKDDPNLADRLEYRIGQVNLFFPQEDGYDVICLFMVSKGNWGFGPETILDNCLRGLREGGRLLAGFLDPCWADPDPIASQAINGGFDLEPAAPPLVSYEDFAPQGVLFTLREKSGRTVGIELLEGIASELQGQGRGNLSSKIQAAIDLAREVGIEKGDSVLVVGPSADLWPERVIAALAGKVDIVLAEDVDPDEAGSEFSFFPGIAAVVGGLQLQQALRNPRNRVHGTESLPSVVALKSFDLICLLDPRTPPHLISTCLSGLETAGKMLLGFHRIKQGETEDLANAATTAGSRLELKKRLNIGSLPVALFQRCQDIPTED